MHTNITIYVPKADRKMVEEATRLIKFYEEKSLSEYLIEQLANYVKTNKGDKYEKENG